MRFEESLLAGELSTESSAESSTATARVGCLDGLDPKGCVYFRADGEETSRRVVLGLDASDEAIVQAALNGARALALCAGNENEPWVLVSLLREGVAPEAAETEESDETGSEGIARPDSAVVDGKTICFEARDEIVLRCGKGSITLRKDGKIVIKGTQLLSRATGVNRIKGGQVNIN